MPTVLNLSNEVVKMRSEVKKVKAFIIRKLTRHMTMLKKKKGKEEEVQRNQRRAARLLEEIHEIKGLVPDTVTKAALQTDINFQKVCQNPEASISERAVARIASHPQFSEKIQSIKDRVSAFKDERTNTSEKKEKTGKPDRSEVTLEKKDESASVSKDAQATAGEDVKILAEKQDENDNPSSEGCATGTDMTVAPHTMPDEEADTLKETSTANKMVEVEVVRMRKEVKKIRVLIISKLTNQIDVLKRKKGEPPEMEANQQKISKLVKEIQGLRSIQPDSVTKAGLQENADLEKVCEDPDASPLQQATARIVTHPRFVKKLQAVREAIQEEERKAAEAEEKRKRRLEQGEDSGNEGSENEESENEEDDEEDSGDEDEEDEADGDEDTEGESDGTDIDNREAEEELDDEEEVLNVRPSTSQVEEETKVMDEHVSIKELGGSVHKQITVKSRPAGISVVKVNQAGTSKTSSTVGGTVKRDANSSPLKKTSTDSPTQESKQISKPPPKTAENRSKAKGTEGEDSESDLSDDEEKPYFDDSTEERFLKQSSVSEESDDDDFFVGKVSKFKKKKSKTPVAAEKKADDAKNSADKDTEQDHKQEETTNKSDFKRSKFESVFCNTLSKGRGASQKHGDRFGAKPPPRFQKQIRQPAPSPREWKQNKDFATDRKPDSSSFKHRKSDSGSAWGQREKSSFGAGRGRQPFDRRQGHSQNQRPPPGRPSSQPRQTAEALHPSWEASKKRKEQMSQITAFQGKKIKFDDDD
ncbi:hypothetical protein ACEWY4_023877 [Coilia grayii]|uniref:Serum response factor-binding protein 1 n=1 Tax=Coilia grayii TaxID=363190 RepID=A0ABD1IYU3_9TELE